MFWISVCPLGPILRRLHSDWRFGSETCLAYCWYPSRSILFCSILKMESSPVHWRLKMFGSWFSFRIRLKRDIIFRNIRHLARNHSTSTYQHTNEKTTHTDIVARYIPENGRSNAFHQCASRRVVLSGNWWRSRSIIITLFNDVVWNGAVGDEPRAPMRSFEHHCYFTQGCFRFAFPHFVWE